MNAPAAGKWARRMICLIAAIAGSLAALAVAGPRAVRELLRAALPLELRERARPLLDGATGRVEIRILSVPSRAATGGAAGAGGAAGTMSATRFGPRPTAAMALIHRPGDDEARLPPDGRILTRPTGIDEYAGSLADEDPPRLDHHPRAVRPPMQGPGGLEVYPADRSLPWWPARHVHPVPSTFTMELPAGDWVIDVARGIEHVPRTVPFLVTAGTTTTCTVELERWIDLPAEGWWSGDVHVHLPTRTAAQRSFLLDLAEAEDLHVVNLLEMGHHGEWYFPQGGFGPAARASRGDRWLVPGQEEPRGNFGHLIGLNLQEKQRDLDHEDPYLGVLRALRDQPGTVLGFAHFAWDGIGLPDGMPWLATADLIDFVELLQFRRMGIPEYYNYLNMGYRLAAAAGSDFPWGGTVGEVRTVVQAGERLDPDRWFEALRHGRTFVTNGPAIEITVGGRGPGAELAEAGPATVRLRARARGHPAVAPLASLTVVGPAGTVREVVARDRPASLEISMELRVTRSQWLVATARATNGAVAHTSPVYVVIAGQPTWCPERGPAVIASRLELIRDLEARIASSADPRDRRVLPYLEAARRHYTDRSHRMTAGWSPASASGTLETP